MGPGAESDGRQATRVNRPNLIQRVCFTEEEMEL